jgi:hypothetical protein
MTDTPLDPPPLHTGSHDLPVTEAAGAADGARLGGRVGC